MRQVGGPRQALINTAAKSANDAQLSAYALWHTIEGIALGANTARGALDYALDLARSIVRHLEATQAIDFDVEPKPKPSTTPIDTELLVQEVSKRIRAAAAAS